jgi:hypothetical protein
MLTRQSICRKLGIDDFSYVEIEAKKRVVPEEAAALKEHLSHLKNARHEKMTLFFDQFLDTPTMDLFKRGVSLRLRYKRNGSRVYMQYKGPGFFHKGLLIRSEFSTPRLTHVMMEESHHDIVHFTETTVKDIVKRHTETRMAEAMRTHLGAGVLARITAGPIISIYQKDKFKVDLGSAFLEPSLDRIFAFHINKRGLHPLSSFCEFENEIKAPADARDAKLEHLEDLLKFNAKLAEQFNLRPEKLDKYHRCTSFFLPKGRH